MLALFVVDTSFDPDADVELVVVGVLEALFDVVEATRPAVVELTTSYTEEVCRVSACVALRLGTVPTLAPVGSAERLKVTPDSAVLIVVLLRRLGKPAVAVNDGCTGNDEVEFAPEPSLVDGTSDSLAGTCVPGVCKGIVVDIAPEVRTAVRFTAAPVTELNRENATVLKSSTLDLTLETYTVEKVAVTISEVMGTLEPA